MREADFLHDQAMTLADRARIAQLRRDPTRHNQLMKRAFCLEREAALLLEESTLEPSRSVIFRSAATMGLKCQEFAEAERLAQIGAQGKPSPHEREQLEQIAEEARKMKRNAPAFKNRSPVFSEYHQCLRSWLMNLGAGREASRTISLTAIRLLYEDWVKGDRRLSFEALKEISKKLWAAEPRLREADRPLAPLSVAGRLPASPPQERFTASGSQRATLESEISGIRQDRLEAIRNELESLPPRMRRCLLMKTAGGSSDEEIAVVFGVSTEQVERTIEAAMERIEEAAS